MLPGVKYFMNISVISSSIALYIDFWRLISIVRYTSCPACGSSWSSTSVTLPTVSTYTDFSPFTPDNSFSMLFSIPDLPTTSLLSYPSPSSSNSELETVPVYPSICEQYTLSTYLLIYCSSTVTPTRPSLFSSIAATVSSDTSFAIINVRYLLYELAAIYLLRLTIIRECSIPNSS